MDQRAGRYEVARPGSNGGDRSDEDDTVGRQQPGLLGVRLANGNLVAAVAGPVRLSRVVKIMGMQDATGPLSAVSFSGEVVYVGLYRTDHTWCGCV